MNSTSRSPRLVRMPMRSAPRSSEGPAVVTSAAPISLAMMVASVVLPSPGGPERRTWSSGSLRCRAASTDTLRLSTAARWPTYSCSRCGRSWRSTCVSSGRATRLITRASSAMPALALASATIDLVEQLLGCGRARPPRERGGDDRGGLARPVAELLDQDVEHQAAEAFLVDRGRRGGLRGRGLRSGERELRDLGL